MPCCPFRCWFNASMQLRKEGRAIGRTGCLSWGFRSSFIWSAVTSCIEGLAYYEKSKEFNYSKVLLGDLAVTLLAAWACLAFAMTFSGNSSTLATSEALLCAYSANIIAILDFAYGAGATSDAAAASTISTGSSSAFFFLYLGLIVRFVIMLLILYIVNSSSRSLF
jgi:hypothetical protein